MKRCLGMILTLALPLILAACAAAPTATEPPAPEPALVVEPEPAPEPFSWKIAIVTAAIDQNEESYFSAEQMAEKYGEDRIIHLTWPSGGEMTKESTLSSPEKIVGDADIKALVINPALPHTNMLVDSLRQLRSDIFIVYCSPIYYPQDDPAKAAQRADLILAQDDVAIGAAMVEQAYKMGAKTFVYYSFPRHMEQPLFSAQRDAVKEKCAELDLDFIYTEALDPTSDVGVVGAQQFILEDVPKMVAKYGADTAFFSTNCALQIPLIKSVVEQKAISP